MQCDSGLHWSIAARSSLFECRDIHSALRIVPRSPVTIGLSLRSVKPLFRIQGKFDLAISIAVLVTLTGALEARRCLSEFMPVFCLRLPVLRIRISRSVHLEWTVLTICPFNTTSALIAKVKRMAYTKRLPSLSIYPYKPSELSLPCTLYSVLHGKTAASHWAQTRYRSLLLLIPHFPCRLPCIIACSCKVQAHQTAIGRRRAWRRKRIFP